MKITYCEQAGLSNVGIYIYSVKNLTMKRTKAVAADSVWDIKMQTGKREYHVDPRIDCCWQFKL